MNLDPRPIVSETKWYIWSNDPDRISVNLYLEYGYAEYVLESYRRHNPEYDWEIKAY